MENAAARTAQAARGMSVAEAKQILNIGSETVSKGDVLAAYRKYYAANDVSKGGSLYLQAKIFNAREALYEEFKFVETPEEEAEDYETLHVAPGAAKAAEEEDMDTEKKPRNQ